MVRPFAGAVLLLMLAAPGAVAETAKPSARDVEVVKTCVFSDRGGERVREGGGSGSNLALAGHDHSDHHDHQGTEQPGAERGGPGARAAELRCPGRRSSGRKGRGHEVGRRQGPLRLGGRSEEEPGQGRDGCGKHPGRGDPGQRAGPVLGVLRRDDRAEADADRDEVIVGVAHAGTGLRSGTVARRRPRMRAPSSRTIQPACAA